MDNSNIELSKKIIEIVHDLKTPITSIIGFAELLQKGGHSEESTKEFYDIIAFEANRLLKQVNDMLYMAKNRTEEESSSNQKCNLSIEIHKYVKELTPLANDRNVSIDIKANSENIYVCIPESKIARILTNIIENAIKYNKKNGNIYIDVSEKSGMVNIAIRDTGIGIAQDELDKIFDKYYRSNSIKSLNVEGSGLGLAIARDLVESYGGNIKVKSELGKSTEFIISFPSSKIN